MTTALVKYDAACRAIAAASRVDELKAIRDEAIKLKLTAKVAKNRKMETDCGIIRSRAERRLDELMKAQAKAVGKAKARGSNRHKKLERGSLSPTLDEAGIDKDLAKRARLLGRIPDKVFEQAMAEARRDSVPPTMKLINALADAAADAEMGKTKPKTKGKAWPKPSPLYDPWSKLSHAVRAIADFKWAEMEALAAQSRRVGFLDIDLQHADRALVQLAAWRNALEWEAKHGQGTTTTQHRDTVAHREGTQEAAKH